MRLSSIFLSLALGLVAAGCGSAELAAESTTTAATTARVSTTAAPTTAAPTTAAPTTAFPAPRGPTAGALCSLTPPAEEPVVVASNALTEVSGIAMSRQHQGLAWAHNDSGDSARLHLVDTETGADLGVWPLEGAFALDWEDMAIHSRGDDNHLYVADFGDNFRFRPNIRIYRAEEPTDPTTPGPLAVEEFVFTYPDGATDAESLFIDPDSGDFVIVSKSRDDSPTSIYRGPAQTEPGARTTLEKIGEVDLTDLHPLVTAADITADGAVIGLRTIDEVLLWERPAGADIGTVMATAPCVAPTAPEPQGEALAFLPDGSGYVTISEGANPPIHRFELGTADPLVAAP